MWGAMLATINNCYKNNPDVLIGIISPGPWGAINPFKTDTMSKLNSHSDTTVNNMAINLLLKDEQGNAVSDCSGDICDYSHTLQESVRLPKGNYVVKLQNQYQWEYLPNTLAVGLTIKKND